MVKEWLRVCLFGQPLNSNVLEKAAEKKIDIRTGAVL